MKIVLLEGLGVSDEFISCQAEKLKEMGEANKTRAEAFSSELVAEKMQGIYERLMKNQIQR